MKISSFKILSAVNVRRNTSKMSPSSVTIPTGFGVDDWSLADAPSAGGDTLTLDVIALPGDGGAPITALEYRVGGGAVQTLSGVGAGARQITVLAATLAGVELRAVNSVGAGLWSAAKMATPTVALSAPSIAASAVRSGQTITFTVTSLTGNPSPTVDFRLLDLNGENVLGALSGFGPWIYTAPHSAADAAVEYRIRAINSESFADSTGTVVVPATLFAPSLFAADHWSLADAPSAGGDTLTLDVIALPGDGGAPITALEYRVGGGAVQTLSGVGAGARQITVLAATLAGVELRAVNSVGAGAWSAVKSATPTVSSGSANPLTSMTITATRTAVTGYEGITYQVSGVSEQTLRDAEFSWDFGAEENYEFTALSADYKGDRFARYARGTVVGHVYLHPGLSDADVTRSVTLTGRIGDSAQTVTLTGITVSNPDAAYRGRTAYVGNPALYADRAAFRTAAQAGSVNGILASDVAGLSLDYFWLAYSEPDPATGWSQGGLIFWRRNTSPTAVKRILLQRGAEWPLFAGVSYGIMGIEHIGAFGTGARPALVAPPVGTLCPGSVFTTDGKTNLPSRHAIWGIEVRGTYDPVNPNRSDLGIFDYSSEMSAVDMQPGIGHITFLDTHMTLYDLDLHGVNGGVTYGDGGFKNSVIANNKIYDWQNYSVYGRFKDSAILGNSLRQPLNTAYPIDADGFSVAEGLKPSNNPKQPNYSDHGTRINTAFNLGFHQNDILQRGGWSSGQQPGIRAGVVWPEKPVPEYDGVIYEGNGLAWAQKSYEIGQRMHMSMTGNTINATGGGISFGYENSGNWMIPPFLFLSEGNYIEIHRTPSGGMNGAYGVESGQVYIRNDFIFAPQLEANGGAFNLIGGTGTKPVSLWTPSGTLAELGGVTMRNVTFASKAQAAQTVNRVSPQTYVFGQIDVDRIKTSDWYTWNWRVIHDWVNTAIAGGVGGAAPAFYPLDPAVKLTSRTALNAWITANWTEASAFLGFVVVARPDADYITADNLYAFGESTFVYGPEFNTPAGANLSAKYQPLVGSSILGAAGVNAVRLDFEGAVRAQPAALGATELGTGLSGFTLPAYAAPVVTARWENALGDDYTPQDGDVFGTDFFAAGFITAPGVPALLEEQLDVIAERKNGTVWEPLTGAVTALQELRVIARALWHPAKQVFETTLTNIPVNVDQFSASAVRFSGDALYGFPSQGTTRAFTLAMAIRPHDNTFAHNLLSDSNAQRVPRLTLSAFNPVSGQAAWQIETNSYDGGVRTGNLVSFADPAYNNVGQAEFMVLTGEIDGANYLRLKLFRNGTLISAAYAGRSATATAVFDFSELAFMKSATNNDGIGTVDVSRFFWLSTGVALDGAAATSAFFDLGLNQARDLGATGAVTIGGVTHAPTLYIAGNAAEWNSGVARVGGAYSVMGALADVGG